MRLPLKAYRVAPRKPFLEVNGAERALDLFLPGYFGRHQWMLDLDAVSIVDLAKVSEGENPGNEALATPADIPYLFTTGPGAAPNVALLFKHPQKTPPVRPLIALASNSELSVGVLESRSHTGGHLDGVLLRFVDASSVTSAIESAGGETVTDLPRWFRTHRQVVSGPVDVALAEHRTRRVRWIARSGYIFFAAAILAAKLDGTDPSAWSLALLIIAVVLTVAMPRLARRLWKRDRARPQTP